MECNADGEDMLGGTMRGKDDDPPDLKLSASSYLNNLISSLGCLDQLVSTTCYSGSSSHLVASKLSRGSRSCSGRMGWDSRGLLRRRMLWTRTLKALVARHFGSSSHLSYGAGRHSGSSCVVCRWSDRITSGSFCVCRWSDRITSATCSF